MALQAPIPHIAIKAGRKTSRCLHRRYEIAPGNVFRWRGYRMARRRNLKRMIAPLAKFIDWSALQLAYAVIGLRHAPKPQWKLEEVLEFLNGPDFIPAVSDPARIEFDGPRHFKFPTPRPDKVEENNIVYGRLYRCAKRWQERPVIILLDGYPPVGYHTAFPLLARRFNRAGFNVATLVAPYHLQRQPRQPIEESCLEFARAMA